MKKITTAVIMVFFSLTTMAQQKDSSARKIIETGDHADIIIGKEIKKASLSNKPEMLTDAPVNSKMHATSVKAKTKTTQIRKKNSNNCKSKKQ